jgi:thiamine-phosphate diphosphorylase
LSRAEREGADFATFSPVFATRSKPDATPAGLDALTEAAASTSLPVYALGGISPDRVSRCREAGAAGVAVMSGILQAADPMGAARAYLRACTEE